MARAIWTGALSFGLVNIPVRGAYGGARAAGRASGCCTRRIKLADQLRTRLPEGRRAGRVGRIWSRATNTRRARFVVLTKEDFAAAALEKTQPDRRARLRRGRSDRRPLLRQAVLPDRRARAARCAYALLREAIRDSGRIGIAKFILRETQHLAAVEAIGDALVLSTLRFADELVDDGARSSFPSGKADSSKTELNMAKTLVENLAADWDPTKYTDDYQREPDAGHQGTR